MPCQSKGKKPFNWHSPTALNLIIFVLIFVLVIVVLNREKHPDFLILVSALALIIGVLFTQSVKLYSEMRDRAFSLLMASRENDNFKKASSYFANYMMGEGNLSKDKLIEIFNAKDGEDKKMAMVVIEIANFFEEVAIAIKYDAVNEKLLREFYIGTFIRFYDSINNLFPLIRNIPLVPDSPFGKNVHPEVFCNLEFLYYNWNPVYLKIYNQSQ